uniref:Uncharacterized protein n=1 Tax=uncultured bacterium contig00029 TaxID=1181518 RepID=A0A806KKH6_9BACT|nr:hypothetical protein [uncultured bacterium contig00029]
MKINALPAFKKIPSKTSKKETGEYPSPSCAAFDIVKNMKMIIAKRSINLM